MESGQLIPPLPYTHTSYPDGMIVFPVPTLTGPPKKERKAVLESWMKDRMEGREGNMAELKSSE
jgi:hypothetical protein